MKSAPNVSPHLPENVVSLSVATGSWHGLNIDVHDYRCAGPVLHLLPSGHQARLSVVLEELGGYCEPRLRPNHPSPIAHMPKHMHFAPAGLEVWGYTDGARAIKDATLTLDQSALEERLGNEFRFDALSIPRMRFADERIWTLVKLLSTAVGDPDPTTQLYGESLSLAVLALLLKPVQAHTTGLAPWQLRRAIDYMQAHLPNRVELAQVAAVSGLSVSHFSRAFKAATGMAPYQWQLDARIRHAQALLSDPSTTLEDVATATGFADAVHFGRTFRRLTGGTPAAWRREQLR